MRPGGRVGGGGRACQAGEGVAGCLTARVWWTSGRKILNGMFMRLMGRIEMSNAGWGNLGKGVASSRRVLICSRDREIWVGRRDAEAWLRNASS
jgi:hypothetical protein